MGDDRTLDLRIERLTRYTSCCAISVLLFESFTAHDVYLVRGSGAEPLFHRGGTARGFDSC